MALARLFRGKSADFTPERVELHDGYMYVVLDDRTLWFDSYVDGVLKRQQITGDAADIDAAIEAALKDEKGKDLYAKVAHADTHKTGGTDELTPADIGAAAEEHGEHVPEPETANNAKFLRNDNTWQTVTPENIGAVPKTRTINDHPLSENIVLAASDVGALPDTTTLADLTDDANHRVVTDEEKAAWNAKSNFSGNYSDLTNKPTTMKNPAALTVGEKTYDGSGAITITASDLGLASAMKFLGTSSTAISDGSATKTITVGGRSITVEAGNVVLYGSKEFVWNGTAWEELGNEGSYKIVQEAVSSPSASGDATAFIDTISQDTNGKITVTKKNVEFPPIPQITVDWMQNDSQFDGYVHNRTHYSSGEMTSVGSRLVNDIQQSSFEYNGEPVYIATLNSGVTLTEGQKYAVDIGDEYFIGVVKRYNDIYTYFGNGHLCFEDVKDTGETYCVRIFGSSAPDILYSPNRTIDTRVYFYTYDETVYPLRPDYIPNNIARKSYVDSAINEIYVPTNVSELNNDVGYITGYTETDPTVPAWAKAANKPSYTASEVGAYTKAEVDAAIQAAINAAFANIARAEEVAF